MESEKVRMMAMRAVTVVAAVVSLGVATAGCERDGGVGDVPVAEDSAPEGKSSPDPFLAIPQCAITQAGKGADPYLAALRAGQPIVSSRKKLRAMTLFYCEALSDGERDAWLDECLKAIGTKGWSRKRWKIFEDLGHRSGYLEVCGQLEDGAATIFNLAVDQVLKNKARGVWMELSQSRYADRMREYEEHQQQHRENPRYGGGVRPDFPRMPVWDFAAIKAKCGEQE